MLKKTLGIALLMASLSVTAFAAIPRDSMHIGGLKPGMTMDQIVAMYGTPEKVNAPSKAAVGMYYIAGRAISGWESDGVFDQYDVDINSPGAQNISVTGDMRLGMTPEDLLNRLGSPDFLETIGSRVFYRYKSIEHGTGSWRQNDMLIYVFENGKLIGVTINVF